MFILMLLPFRQKRMIDKMNDNASVIVVLCSRLCSESCRPLEPSEWSRLADAMIARKLEPKDIPELSDNDLNSFPGSDAERIKRLLDRAGSLSFELEKLHSIGIKIVTRADKDYPKALKTKLREGCPPLFYYAGDISLLKRKTVGFVGSRDIDGGDTSFTERTVEKINKPGFGVVSGGAKGVDSTSSAVSLSNGSFCIEYISDSLLRRMKKKEIISAVQEGQLLLMSMAKPDAGFNVGMAMQRNKFIYSQSEATVVVRSDYNKGGTWSGATEALKKGYCPVLCRRCNQYKGNTELIKLGAVPIDDSWDGDVYNIDTLNGSEGEQISLFEE